MAESYRGLTIKIGGDTTKLTHALHAANQAIAGTQSELRKLSTAARLDPSSFKVASLQMGAMAEQASNAATKLFTLNTAIKQIGSEQVTLGDGSVTTLQQMVEKARDVQIQVTLMRDSFSAANAELERSYRQLTKWSSEFGSGKIFNVVNDNTDIEKLEAEFKKLKDEISGFSEEELKFLGVDVTIEQLDEALASIMRLKDESIKFGDALSQARKNARFEDLESEAAKVEATITSFVNKLVEANENSALGEAMSEVAGELSIVERSIDSAKNRVKQLDQALKFDPKNQELLHERMLAVRDGAAAAQQKVEILRKVLENLKAKGLGESAKSTEELSTNAIEAAKSFRALKEEQAKNDAILNTQKRDLQEIEVILAKTPDAVNEQGVAYKNVYATLKDAYERMKAYVNEFDKEVEESSENMKRAYGEVSFRKIIEAMHEAMTEAEHFGETSVTPKVNDAAFMQAVNMVVQAAQRMASEVVQASNEIDAAYRDMRKTVNGTEHDFEKLHDAAVEYSQTHITSADTMLEMQALGGQLGVLVEDLEEFGKITSNLDISTDMGAEDIALRLGQVAQVLNLDIEGMNGFSDALVRLGNNMPAQESAIMNVAQRFAAVASTASFTGDEILAWSAAIASTGQRSEAAATAIGNTVSAIEQSIANGGSDLKQFAAISKMSAEEFEQAWKKDPTEALQAFINGLQTLKDSDESAVAALENMGITSVRAQQTLLGLSQTIDNLDNALEMSRDAWNGVSDQWGQAGDAANEAQKKSEGFSGQLAILQNNAQNLAASFGDGLIPLMQAGTAVLQLLTDAFNSMPARVKQVISCVSAVGITMGVALPIVKALADGYKVLLGAMGAGNIGSIISQLAGLSSGLAGTEAAATGAAAAISGPFVVGVLAAVAVVAGLASGIMEAIEAQQTYEEATTGLITATQNLTTSYNEQSANMVTVGDSLIYLREKTDELIESQAALAEEMRDVWGDVGSKEAQVDAYAKKIDDLSGKMRLTEDEQRQLIAAVDEYNELTGSSISVLNAEKGLLDGVSGKLTDHAEAWKKHLESTTAVDEWNRLVAEQTDLESQLALAKQNLADAQEKEKNSTANAYTGVNEAANLTKAYEQDVAKLTESLNDNMIAQQQQLDLMSSSDEAMANLGRELESVGDSMDNYTMLTESDWAKVLQAYARSTNEAIRLLQQLKREYNDASGIADALESSSKDAVEKAYNAAKKQYDAEYKELKRSLDSQYKARQREYDAEYKQAQRASDAAYKVKQREFDAVYKAAQKAYDAEYKAAQKAYESEYNDYKKYLDKRYNDLKKSLDNEYNAQKKTYDSELKAFKKAQDAQTDAFKKATDNRLKAMEAEYNQKVKLLELEYGKKDSNLDDRIKELEAETEAEKKAIEEREQNEKIAELQKAVDQAKSRRTRAEAEKELSDYLQELDQKRNEDLRATEIERIKEQQDALKDELEQRKEILKEQYDADVEAYKEKREMELDALKEANDVEYEARQEYYNLQLEQLKEANDAQLEAEKEANDLVLEQMKEYQTAQLEALKENQTASLESLKQSQQDELDAFKQGQQDELEALKQSQQDKLAALKESHQKQLDDTKAAQQEKLDAIKNGNAEEAEENKKAKDEAEKTGKEHGEVYNNGIAAGYEKAIGTSKVASERMIDNMEWAKTEAENTGEETGLEYNNGIANGLDHAIGTSKVGSEQINDALRDAVGESDGEDMMINFSNGMSYGLSNYVYRTAMDAAQSLRNIMGFSVPKEGPLHHQDLWGIHFMENIMDGMRSKEDELYRQVDRMARAIEDGFDPTLSVDAAYDAIDTINRRRASSAAQAASYAGDKNTTIEVNVNLSNVSFRSDADIEKLANEVSQRMAAQVRRQQAGRL